MPTISVVIPAYNSESTILETIASVQQQSFSDIEIIVINDGSTDQTLELCHSVQDPRLKVLSYKNSGVSVARNRGIDHATGEFIAFIDADDLWETDKLELQLTTLQKNPQAGVAYSWTSTMGENGEWFKPCNQLSFEGNVYADLLASYFIYCGSNVLVRRQAIESIGKFDSTLTHGEDWEFNLRLAARWSFVVVRKIQIFYRQSPKSAVSNIEAMHKGNFIVLDRAFKAAPLELEIIKNKCFSNLYLYSAELYLKHKNDKTSIRQAAEKLWTAIQLHPKNLLNQYTQSLAKWLIKKWFKIYLIKNKYS